MKIQTSFKSLASAFAALALTGSAALAAAGDGHIGMTILSASVNADGTPLRGEGLNTSFSLGTGTYEVSFTRNITQCTYYATQGEGGVGGAGGAITGITQRSGNDHGVFVTMRDATGALINTPFFVLVFCGR